MERQEEYETLLGKIIRESPSMGYKLAHLEPDMETVRSVHGAIQSIRGQATSTSPFTGLLKTILGTSKRRSHLKKARDVAAIVKETADAGQPQNALIIELDKAKPDVSDDMIDLARAAVQAGHNPQGIGYQINQAVGEGGIGLDALRTLKPRLLAETEKGRDPHDLLRLVRAGVKSKAFHKEGLEGMADYFSGAMDRFSAKTKKPMHEFTIPVGGCLEQHQYGNIAPSLTKRMVEFAEKGYDPRPMFSAGQIALGQVTWPADIKKTVDEICDHFEYIQKKGFDPNELVGHISIASNELSGVPIPTILKHQREFIDKGHFPTAGGLIAYHDRVSKEREKRRKT